MINSFFLYSLPHTNFFYFISNQNSGKFKILFKSFLSDQKFTIEFDQREMVQFEELQNFCGNIALPKNTQLIYELDSTSYVEKLSRLIEEMKIKEVDKVVFSRIISKDFSIDLAKTLLKLKINNPNTLVYLAQSGTETWMGATPEILLSETENYFQTMSLAGTLPIDQEWTNKEIEEQQMVTHYIASQLQKLNVEFTVSPLENLEQGNFKHLVQYFQIEKDEVSFQKIIEYLHPTPAVCGVPKEEALALISEFENYNRQYYTGYIHIENEDENQAFVNLRCAQLFENQQHIYVGGGITQDSNPSKEWKETELKSEVMIRNWVLNQ